MAQAAAVALNSLPEIILFLTRLLYAIILYYQNVIFIGKAMPSARSRLCGKHKRRKDEFFCFPRLYFVLQGAVETVPCDVINFS